MATKSSDPRFPSWTYDAKDALLDFMQLKPQEHLFLKFGAIV
jgi:hypothetical protein